MKEKMIEALAKHNRDGSGWRLNKIEGLKIYITKYKPLKGIKHKDLPYVVRTTKGVINMKNNDDKCFMWADDKCFMWAN